MRDAIRQALRDLTYLSLQLEGPDHARVLKTIERFRDYDEQEDHALHLYGQISLEEQSR